jgi:hypothetical protein
MKLLTNKISSTEPKVAVAQPTNRIVALDCSGSMSYDLPKIRTQLKNKLPTMVQPQDTLTIIWFSGRGQCGILFEATKLDSLVDIQRVSTAIDRFIVPVGLTGFKEPLELVNDLTDRLVGDCSLYFLTDGAENVSSMKDVLTVCKAVSEKLTSAAIIEYGFYANSKMILDMAEEIGGSVVLAENFTNYADSIEASMKNSVSGKKIKLHKITAEYVVGNLPDGFVIARPDAVGTVTLPANATSYSYFEGTGDIDGLADPHGRVDHEVAYAVSALILRGEADKALQLAGIIGDEVLYTQVENSFSKQDYARTVELANAFGSGKKKLYENGPRKGNLLPDENAYNVLTLLMDLAAEDGNYLHLSHPDFSYTAGGASRTAVESEDGFKPVFKDKSGDIKAAITALKFDEDRPNINILVKREGTVTVPENDLGFKDTVDSYIWRNYSIVRDGIVNVQKMPVVLSKTSYDKLAGAGVISEPFKVGQTYVIDTKKLPVINRSMVKSKSASDLFKDYFTLYQLRTTQKILNSKIEKPEVGAKFESLYGEEGAKFLKELGISEGGFSPKTVKGESLDPYTAKVLEVKLAGMSGIPKIEDVEKAIAAGKKLTPSQEVMSNALTLVMTSKESYESQLNVVKKQLKVLMDSIVKTKFGVILGKKWFGDITLENPSMDIDFGLGKVIKCTACLEDKEV